MTDTVVTPYPLTREDVRALRSSGSVSFHAFDGRATIQTNEVGSDSSTVRTHGIPAGWSVWSYDRDHWGNQLTSGVDAYHGIQHARNDEAWQTIARRILPGATLRLLWTAGNDTESLQSAGFHADELRLTVTRDGKTDTYFIGYKVSRHDSSRMIRWER